MYDIEQKQREITYGEFRQKVVDSQKGYNLEMIDKAYELANKAHEGQTRASGEPYISHPVAVADLLLDLGMDSESLIAAILHDVVEDTEIPLEEIASSFGEEVAFLVDGVTKLTRIKFSSLEEKQAENLRKMLLAMIKDIRVMLIKLCDRLHNIRTLYGKPGAKRGYTALETIEVYAPIAHRLGLNVIKEELEDRSLYYIDEYTYKQIVDMIGQKTDAQDFIETIANSIQQHLEENGIKDAEIKFRVKSIYSIFKKMYIQNKSFEEMYDIFALRVIVNTIPECYAALGIIHELYHPLPNRFKDFISIRSSDSYQSLHTTLISREGIAFEVQIRTYDMDHVAEYGVVAHWKYKAGALGNDKMDERLASIRQILEGQRYSEDGGDILRDIKNELLPEEVLPLTPKGEVITLPTGATTIDFAYAIHSAVGNNMVGAKVDGRIVPIDHKVQSSEVVEIITSTKSKGPSRDWLNIVVTSGARNKIRAWFKKERREENIEFGRSQLEREINRYHLRLDKKEYIEFMELVAERLHVNSVEEMYAAIGYGGIQLSRLVPVAKDEYAKLIKSRTQDDETPELAALPRSKPSKEGVIIEGIDNIPIKFSKCCSPLPGDAIVGYITRGYGVSIHNRNCVNARNPANTERWVYASWAEEIKEEFRTTLEILALDRERLFMDISAQFADMRVPLYSINARATGDGRAVITASVALQSIEHLQTVMSRLRKVKDVINVERLSSS